MTSDPLRLTVMAASADEIVDAVRPLLAGRGGGVQGAALAELTACWLAGHHPAMRERALGLWLETVRALIPICEEEIFAGKPRPEGWLAS